MKKGLLYLSLVALMGAASLTACVNNEESASITALRDAKSEQLKSIAAVNNAQAAKDSAAAKLTELQVALDKAKQDATLAGTIKAAIQKAEAELLAAQKDYQTALNAYEAERANNPNPYLDGLVTKYTAATSALVAANTEVQTAKAILAAAEAAQEADPTPENEQAVAVAKQALAVAQTQLEVCQFQADFFKAEIDNAIKK